VHQYGGTLDCLPETVYSDNLRNTPEPAMAERTITRGKGPPPPEGHRSCRYRPGIHRQRIPDSCSGLQEQLFVVFCDTTEQQATG
jgi:hypothetical protein